MDIGMPVSGGVAEVRRLTVEDLRWALQEGWADYRERRGELLLLPLIYVLVGVLAAFVAYKADLFPLLFPAVAGFALMGPVAAAGFYELARRRQAGQASGWSHFLDPMKGRSRWPFLGLSLLLLLWFLCWLWAASAIHDATLRQLGPATPDAFLRLLFSTPEGRQMVLLGNLVGAGFALVALAVSAISFPMVVDKGADLWSAIGTSVAVFRRNPGTMLLWGFLVSVILFLACLPLFVGLMVALPVLGYATWHLYTRAVVR